MHGLAHNANRCGILRPEQARQLDRSLDVSFGVAGLKKGLRESARNAAIQDADFTQST